MTILAAGLTAGRVFAYDASTHQAMTLGSITLATHRGADNLELLSFADVIVEANAREDDPPRFECHFYDPRTGLGLPINSYTRLYERWLGGRIGGQTGAGNTLRFVSALDWATSNMPDDLDWEGAINAWGDAPADRRKAWTAFGHVLHLLQDMAQPDHAEDRPHPGNYFPEKIRKYVPVEGNWAAEKFAGNRMGYEVFASEKAVASSVTDDPAGHEPKRFDWLKEGFDAVAHRSHEEEKRLGIPMAGEIACGLGPIAWADSEPSAREFAKRTGKAFQDNLWLKFELNGAFMPTIPNVPADPIYKNYLELYKAMMPVAEEYGAGLLLLFQDIVRPPPYVERLELLQKGVVKYRGAWSAVTAGHRTLAASPNDPLEAGVPAEVRMWLGPRPPAGVKSGPDLWKRSVVRSLRVESDGGETANIPVASPEQDADGWVHFTATFAPTKGGTLVVDASDGLGHFEGRDPEHKGLRGDLLDSNPATVAKAEGLRPYSLKSYEPGPDRNHRFKVGGGCPGGDMTRAELIKTMRYGTWQGWIKYEEKYVDTWALAGHTETINVSTEVKDLKLRSIFQDRDDTAWIGGRHGTWKTKGSNRFVYTDGTTKPPGDDDFSGEPFVAEGRLQVLPDPHEVVGAYRINALLFMDGKQWDGQSHVAHGFPVKDFAAGNMTLTGTICRDGLRGSLGDHFLKSGAAGTNDLTWKATWEFKRTDEGPPPHVGVIASVPTSSAVVNAVMAYTSEVLKLQRDISAASSRRGAEASRAYGQASLAFSKASNTSELLKGLHAAGMSHDMDYAWLDRKPEDAADYARLAAELKTMVKTFQDDEKAFVNSLAAATTAFAAAVRAADPDDADKLDALALRLSREKLAGFGLKEPPGY